jgi:hypothetical protein
MARVCAKHTPEGEARVNTNVGKGFVAGMIGGAVFSVVMALGRSMGLPLNLEMILGTFAGGQMDLVHWLVGFAIELVIAGGVGVAFAAGFELVRRADWLAGVAFSVPAIWVFGLMLALVPYAHPLVPERLTPPGAFYANGGYWAIQLFVFAMAAAGSVVGALYDNVPAKHTTRITR